MSTREVKRKNRTNHCPFPNRKCSTAWSNPNRNVLVRSSDKNEKPNCPFLRTRYIYVGEAERDCDKELRKENKCIWQDIIKPFYKNTGTPTDKVYMSYCDTCKMVTRHFNGDCIKCNYEELDEDCYDPEK